MMISVPVKEYADRDSFTDCKLTHPNYFHQQETEMFRDAQIESNKLIENMNNNNNLIKVDECMEATECIEVKN